MKLLLNSHLKVLFFAVSLLSFSHAFCEDEDWAGGVSFTIGYGPKQGLEQILNGGIAHSVDNGNTICFDFTTFRYIMNDYDRIGIGGGGGIGVRSYNFKEMYTDDESPYDTRKTRFDVHAGPSLRISCIQGILDICISPQGVLWYAGMTDNGPKVNFGFNLTGDIILGRIFTIGISYRPTKAQIASTKWNIYYNSNMYYLIKPSFELRAGIYLLYP